MKRLLTLGLAAGGCAGTEPATTVELPVATAPDSLTPAITDLGYRVELARVQIAVTAIQFTIDGEFHDEAVRDDIAYHPGHAGGGEVTGELPGDFLLAFDGTMHELGTGTLVINDYTGANVAFRKANAAELPAGDPLVGHTFRLSGTVSRDGTTRSFDAILDVEPGAAIVGAVFDDTITERSSETLAITFYPTDPTEHDTVFDGIDFFALPVASIGSLEIRPDTTAHNVIRRVIQTHDHYGVLPR